MTEALNQRSLILSDLARVGCCYCCALTLLNVSDLSNYFSASAACEQLQIVFPSSKCTCCLGLLQETLTPDSLSVRGVANQILSELEKAKFFNVKSFFLTFNLPVSVVVHRHAVTRYIRELHNVDLNPDVLILKVSD